MTTSTQFPLDDLPEQERNLLYLVYSLITVSLAVDMWGQPEVIDSGNALFFRTVEPIPVTTAIPARHDE